MSKSSLAVVKGSGWKSHLTMVNGIAGGRAGDATRVAGTPVLIRTENPLFGGY